MESLGIGENLEIAENNLLLQTINILKDLKLTRDFEDELVSSLRRSTEVEAS